MLHELSGRYRSEGFPEGVDYVQMSAWVGEDRDGSRDREGVGSKEGFGGGWLTHF